MTAFTHRWTPRFRGAREHIAANSFVDSVLGTVVRLVELGCFHHVDARGVADLEDPELGALRLATGLLVELLDGRNDDNPNDEECPSSFTVSVVTRPIFACKVSITPISTLTLTLAFTRITR